MQALGQIIPFVLFSLSIPFFSNKKKSLIPRPPQSSHNKAARVKAKVEDAIVKQIDSVKRIES